MEHTSELCGQKYNFWNLVVRKVTTGP